MDPQTENQLPPPPQPSPDSPLPPPNVTIQPTQNPSVMTPPAATNPAPSQVVSVAGLNPGFSQADALSMDRQARHKKRLRLGAVILIVAALLIAGLFASGVLSSWKTITYDNGVGTKYELGFYSKYDVKNVSEFGRSASALADSSSSAKQLVSKVSKDGKAPLTLLISSAPLSGSGASAYNRLKDCPATLPKAFSVRNTASGNTVNLCGISEEGKDIIYMGVLKDKDEKNFHIILAVQDVGDTSKLDSKEEAQAFLDKVDLKTYQPDLEKSIASLKVTK